MSCNHRSDYLNNICHHGWAQGVAINNPIIFRGPALSQRQNIIPECTPKGGNIGGHLRMLSTVIID
jgi:hypothetical protein